MAALHPVESGRDVRGTHSIADDMCTADGDLAAHAPSLHTGSIGDSTCCMGSRMGHPCCAEQFPTAEWKWTTRYSRQDQIGHQRRSAALSRTVGRGARQALPYSPRSPISRPRIAGPRSRNAEPMLHFDSRHSDHITGAYALGWLRSERGCGGSSPAGSHGLMPALWVVSGGAVSHTCGQPGRLGRQLLTLLQRRDTVDPTSHRPRTGDGTLRRSTTNLLLRLPDLRSESPRGPEGIVPPGSGPPM
jgi:hypothetical protein